MLQMHRSYRDVMKKEIIMTQDQRNLRDVLNKPKVTYLDYPIMHFFVEVI